MTPVVVALVLAAAIGHASWNLLAKRVGGGAAFVWLVSAIGVVAVRAGSGGAARSGPSGPARGGGGGDRSERGASGGLLSLAPTCVPRGGPLVGVSTGSRKRATPGAGGGGGSAG